MESLKYAAFSVGDGSRASPRRDRIWDFIGLVTDKEGKRFFILKDVKTDEEFCYFLGAGVSVLNEEFVKPSDTIKILITAGGALAIAFINKT